MNSAPDFVFINEIVSILKIPSLHNVYCDDNMDCIKLTYEKIWARALSHPLYVCLKNILHYF